MLHDWINAGVTSIRTHDADGNSPSPLLAWAVKVFQHPHQQGLK